MYTTVRQHLALHQADRQYTAQIRKYGCTPAGVHWKNLQTQRERFQLLCEIIESREDSRHLSVLDFGCGYGALWKYLLEKRYQGTYLGYDRNKEMIEMATDLHQHPNVRFVRDSIVQESADLTFISGTFNLKMSAPSDVWWAYIQRQLTALWNKTHTALAFNILLPSMYPLSTLYYGNTSEVLNFCRELTDNVQWKVAPTIGDLNVYLRR